jgi:ATP synthase protein I
MSSSPNAPRKRAPRFVNQLAMAMELPFIMIGGVLIGGGLGWLLDRWLHTSPAFALVLGFLGFAAGIWDILKRLNRMDKKDQPGNGGG